MLNLPDHRPLLILLLLMFPLGFWKLIEIILWVAAHVRWVAP